MFTRKTLSILLIASAVTLALGFIPARATPDQSSPAAPAAAWTFQGRLYAGEVGNESHPLEGVTVSIYGANNPFPADGTA